MFERFTDPITIVRMIQQGDLSRLRKVISAGAKIDRRTSGEPWMTPRVRHFDPIFRPRWDSGVMQINYLHALMRLFPSFCVVPICT